MAAHIVDGRLQGRAFSIMRSVREVEIIRVQVPEKIRVLKDVDFSSPQSGNFEPMATRTRKFKESGGRKSKAKK